MRNKVDVNAVASDALEGERIARLEQPLEQLSIKCCAVHRKRRVGLKLLRGESMAWTRLPRDAHDRPSA